MNAQDVILTYSKIYETINIFSSIQLHQLRVAKVAKQIAMKINKEVNTDNIIAAGLLHDMGNMVKIDFHSSLAKEFLRFDEHDADYWTEVKEKQIEEFGEWSHTATENILKKLEIEQDIVELINFSSWQHIQEIIDGDNWDAKVLAYADYRVMPSGVTSLDNRLADLRRRYHSNDEFQKNQEEAIKIDKLYHELEIQLIEAGLVANEVTDDSIAELLI